MNNDELEKVAGGKTITETDIKRAFGTAELRLDVQASHEVLNRKKYQIMEDMSDVCRDVYLGTKTVNEAMAELETLYASLPSTGGVYSVMKDLKSDIGWPAA